MTIFMLMLETTTTMTDTTSNINFDGTTTNKMTTNMTDTMPTTNCDSSVTGETTTNMTDTTSNTNFGGAATNKMTTIMTDTISTTNLGSAATNKIITISDTNKIIMNQNFGMTTMDHPSEISEDASDMSKTTTSVTLRMNEVIVKKKKCTIHNGYGSSIDSSLYALTEKVVRVGHYIPIALGNTVIIFENDSGTSVTQVFTTHVRDLRRSGIQMQLPNPTVVWKTITSQEDMKMQL